jgi:CDP-diacylglycerol--serine O-phosphatidyltransferase
MFQPRYLIPNGITALSMMLAMWSIFQSIDGYHDQAAWWIVWCVLLDRADGVAARLVRASSKFGQEFDSLADLLAFCIAPSVLSYVVLTRDPRYASSEAALDRSAVIAIVALYFLCGAIRLARYNVTHEDAPGWFRGLPTTIAGALVSSGFLAARQLGLDAIVPWGLPLLLAACALLMISSLWLRKEVRPRSRLALGVGVLLVASVYGLGFARHYPGYIFAAILAYPAIGFVLGALRPPAPRAPHPAPHAITASE